MVGTDIKIDPNKKYFIKFVLDARYLAEVQGNNIEDLLNKANIIFSDADFGDACDIDGYAISIEDENGSYLLDDFSKLIR